MSKQESNQPPTEKTRGLNKYIHELKGPATLHPAEIKDIVESRLKPNARELMAEKYGISASRITKIWTEFYGGSRIKDALSGIKKELPTTDITGTKSKRVFKSERAEYHAAEPTTVQAKKAQPVRAIKARKRELNLDNVVELNDEDTAIMSGQLNAGNNSAELMAAISELIKSNQNVSAGAMKSLQLALKRAKLRPDYSEEDYETDNIDTDYDDSTAYTKTEVYGTRNSRAVPKRNTTNEKGHGRNKEPIYPVASNQYVESDSEDSGEDYEHRVSNNIRAVPMGLVLGPVGLDKGDRLHVARTGERARPIHGITGERATLREEQDDTYEDPRHEQAISTAKRNTSTIGLQQNPKGNNIERDAKSKYLGRTASESGIGTRPTLEGIPWLPRRPH